MGIDYGLSMMFKDRPLHQKEHKEAVEKRNKCVKIMTEHYNEELAEAELKKAEEEAKAFIEQRKLERKLEKANRWDFDQ